MKFWEMSMGPITVDSIPDIIDEEHKKSLLDRFLEENNIFAAYQQIFYLQSYNHHSMAKSLVESVGLLSSVPKVFEKIWYFKMVFNPPIIVNMSEKKVFDNINNKYIPTTQEEFEKYIKQEELRRSSINLYMMVISAILKLSPQHFYEALDTIFKNNSCEESTEFCRNIFRIVISQSPAFGKEYYKKYIHYLLPFDDYLFDILNLYYSDKDYNKAAIIIENYLKESILDNKELHGNYNDIIRLLGKMYLQKGVLPSDWNLAAKLSQKNWHLERLYICLCAYFCRNSQRDLLELLSQALIDHGTKKEKISLDYIFTFQPSPAMDRSIVDALMNSSLLEKCQLTEEQLIELGNGDISNLVNSSSVYIDLINLIDFKILQKHPDRIAKEYERNIKTDSEEFFRELIIYSLLNYPEKCKNFVWPLLSEDEKEYASRLSTESMKLVHLLQFLRMNNIPVIITPDEVFPDYRLVFLQLYEVLLMQQYIVAGNIDLENIQMIFPAVSNQIEVIKNFTDKVPALPEFQFITSNSPQEAFYYYSLMWYKNALLKTKEINADNKSFQLSYLYYMFGEMSKTLNLKKLAYGYYITAVNTLPEEYSDFRQIILKKLTIIKHMLEITSNKEYSLSKKQSGKVNIEQRPYYSYYLSLQSFEQLKNKSPDVAIIMALMGLSQKYEVGFDFLSDFDTIDYLQRSTIEYERIVLYAINKEEYFWALRIIDVLKARVFIRNIDKFHISYMSVNITNMNDDNQDFIRRFQHLHTLCGYQENVTALLQFFIPSNRENIYVLVCSDFEQNGVASIKKIVIPYNEELQEIINLFSPDVWFNQEIDENEMIKSPFNRKKITDRELRDLYIKLWKPIDDVLLDNNVDRVVVIPDKELYHIPFSALLIEDKYLVESRKYILSYSLSLSMLNACAAFPTRKIQKVKAIDLIPHDSGVLTEVGLGEKNMLAQFPDFNVFHPLGPDEYSLFEVKSNNKVYAEKSLNNFFQENEDIDLFVTTGHGCFFNDASERVFSSCIRFGFEDEIPSINDLPVIRIPSEGGVCICLYTLRYYLNREGFSVIALSCNNAASSGSSSNEPLGLLWGFFSGGAKNLTAALWEVYGGFYQEALPEYFKDISNGVPLDEALREMQLRALKNSNYKHPEFWSSLQCYGWPF